MILSMEHRLRLLERNGIDLAVVIPFDEEVRNTSAHDFLSRFLVGALRAKAVILGHDSTIGKNREGNLAFLKKHAGSLGIEVHAAQEVSVGGKAISSTRIREAIRSGDLRLAEEMLGREVSILGEVVRGDGRGRQLGFPTANVASQTETIPPTGVYEVTVLFRGIRRRAVLSIGTKPTFHGSREAQTAIEVHIPGFSGELYGEFLEVFIVRKIRDQRRFDSVEELLQNIRKDIRSLGLPAPRNDSNAS
jgi:riboflavin kinase/FMN adenylyltransferase